MRVEVEKVGESLFLVKPKGLFWSPYSRLLEGLKQIEAQGYGIVSMRKFLDWWNDRYLVMVGRKEGIGGLVGRKQLGQCPVCGKRFQ